MNELFWVLMIWCFLESRLFRAMVVLLIVFAVLGSRIWVIVALVVVAPFLCYLGDRLHGIDEDLRVAKSPECRHES